MKDENPKKVAQEYLDHVKAHAEKITVSADRLQENPERILEHEHNTNKILTSIEDISTYASSAIEVMDKYREEEYDNPHCEICGAEQELAVTSSNIQGYLCPNCDTPDNE